MPTLKAFKAAHNLSDSGFKRLTARVLAARPGLILTARIPGNSTDWEVLEVEVLVMAITDFEQFPKVRSRIPVVAPIESIDAEFVESPQRPDIGDSSLTHHRNELTEIKGATPALLALLAAADQVMAGLAHRDQVARAATEAAKQQAQEIRIKRLELAARLEVSQELGAKEAARKAHWDAQLEQESEGFMEEYDLAKKRSA